MKKFICNSLAYSSTLTSAIFTIVPEAFFAKYKLISQEFFKQFKTFTSEDVQLLNITTPIISKKPVKPGKSRDRGTEFTTKLLLLD